MAYKSRLAISLLICLHGLAVVLHGIAHGGVNVLPALASGVFIGIVIYIAPLVALYLLYTSQFRWGILLLLLSMLGSLIFGLGEHFLLPGPGNIATTPPGIWQFPFRLTAILLALIEASGAIAGAWLLFASRRFQVTQC